MTSLVLSGGGARGAYQAGVLKAIAQICAKNNLNQPFKVLTGVSAGAINASFLAGHADDFINGTEKLVDLWSQLSTDQVFKGDTLSLSALGLKWIQGLSLGGLTGAAPPRSLLDTAPLRELIGQHIPFDNIQKNINAGHLNALAITAVDYYSSLAITFVQGKENTPSWLKPRRLSENSVINADHVMASSAIPLLFPSIKVDERHFGDGCLRNYAPLSPAIHLGGNKVIAIGVRKETNIEQSLKLQKNKNPSVARIANVILNSILLDGIELDINRLNKINEFVEKIPLDLRTDLNFRKVDYVWIHPSIDIGQLAFDHVRNLPRFVRYLLKGLGETADAKEIISYLLFDAEFCQKLIAIGYDDGLKQEDAIIKILTNTHN